MPKYEFDVWVKGKKIRVHATAKLPEEAFDKVKKKYPKADIGFDHLKNAQFGLW